MKRMKRSGEEWRGVESNLEDQIDQSTPIKMQGKSNAMDELQTVCDEIKELKDSISEEKQEISTIEGFMKTIGD